MQHEVTNKTAPKNVKVGDTVVIYSRHKAAWLAQLGGESAKYGRERHFLPNSLHRGGMSKQIVTYVYEITEIGEYQCAGDDFGAFRYTFTVKE